MRLQVRLLLHEARGWREAGLDGGSAPREPSGCRTLAALQLVQVGLHECSGERRVGIGRGADDRRAWIRVQMGPVRWIGAAVGFEVQWRRAKASGAPA